MQKERLFFLDGVRTLVVLLVVILHAACAYSVIIPWWPVRETPHTAAFTILIILLDLFCMPSLFFIAGFFAPKSLKRHGMSDFIINKWKRLGIPLVLLSLFFVPLITFIGYTANVPSPQSFFSHWLFQLSTAWRPELVVFDSPATSIPHAYDLSQWHLWFISLLLIFFFIYAATSRIINNFLRKLTPTDITVWTIVIQITVACSLAITAFTASAMTIPAWVWVKVGGYLMFQPSRLGLYLAFFLLGVVAEHSKWFQKVDIPGSFCLWLVASVIFNIVFLAVGKTLSMVTGSSPFNLALLHATIRTFGALSCLVTLIKGMQLWWSEPGRLRSSLSKSSYDIYLLHLPLIVVAQRLLVPLNMGLSIKFAIEGVAVIGACWLFSKYIALPYPRVAIGVLAAYFLGLYLIF